MRLYSTNDRTHVVGFAEAMERSIAPDGGLYMPLQLPHFSRSLLDSFRSAPFDEVAREVARRLLGDTVPDDIMSGIVSDSFSFPVRLHPLDEQLSVLELFHGPTLAFKDFGARFMARLMSWFHRGEDRETTILVATSGDTGGAVAGGFSGVGGTQVVLLYPAGRVSPLQELQLTTGGSNITALRVKGSFDDCQQMAKQAFVDRSLVKRGTLTSANSINIARLLPQLLYYFWAWGQASRGGEGVEFVVPSGNLGNLTAGLMARAIGLPVSRFIAATNANPVFPEYLQTGHYRPRHALHTLSNAMDVGDPSNLPRIRHLFGDNPAALREVVLSGSATDDDTRAATSEAHATFRYIFDPHGAVGYHVWTKERGGPGGGRDRAILLATAHPAKFLEGLPEELRRLVPVPDSLQALKHRPRRFVEISADYDALKQILTSRSS